ncbi:MAG: siroheme synthase, partial [Burkholderiales bacterium 21-58-4]
EHAQSVRLITAHSSHHDDTHDWLSFAQGKQTLAFYMGRSQLPWLSRQLIEHGCPGETPFALIENGTRSNQRVLGGPLKDLAALANKYGFEAPSLLLVGDTVKLAENLHWFGARINARTNPHANAAVAEWVMAA